MREVQSKAKALDGISGKAVQLVALLNMCSGGGFDAFKDMTDEMQGYVLWLASDLAAQISEIANEVQHG